jgi:hypothetical protein
MRLSRSNNTMNMLLATLLVVNSVGAYGYHHAHAGGDESHSHGGDAIVTHECDSHTCPEHDDHSRENPNEGETRLASATIAHAHFSFFGFELSIPDSDDSRQHDDDPRSMTFVSLGDDCEVVVSARYADIELLRTLSLTAYNSDVAATPTAEPSTPQVLSKCLCDSARFERCGVLLI